MCNYHDCQEKEGHCTNKYERQYFTFEFLAGETKSDCTSLFCFICSILHPPSWNHNSTHMAAATDQGSYLTKKICLPNGQHATITRFRDGKYLYRTWDSKQAKHIKTNEIPAAIERYNTQINEIVNSPLNKFAKQEFDAIDKQNKNNSNNDNNNNTSKKAQNSDEKEEKKTDGGGTNVNNDKLNVTKHDMKTIYSCEIEWILSKRDLTFDEKQIKIELDKEEFKQLSNEIQSFLKKNKDIIKKYKIQSLVEKSQKNIINNSFTLNNNGDDSKNNETTIIDNGKYCEYVFGALNWQGVSSRWRDFIKFIQNKLDDCVATQENTKHNPNDTNNNDFENIAQNMFYSNAKAALYGFGIELGRVISYRALALTNDGYSKIINSNEILPTGGLVASPMDLVQLVNKQGITRITVARLYIRYLSEWIGIDPSLSLHDDFETALCIAQTYMSESKFDENKRKPIYLFEMNVPKIHCIGWKVCDVQNRAYLVDSKFGMPNSNSDSHQENRNAKETNRWFEHNRIWFDADNERTERQLLYTIPFLKERCQKIEKIETKAKLLQMIEPFRVKQLKLKQESESSPQDDKIKAILNQKK